MPGPYGAADTFSPKGRRLLVSSKGFPFGGSCRPQAADEGKVRVASLLTGNRSRFGPHPASQARPPSPDGEGFYASFPFTSATCFITLAFVGPP